MVSLHNLHIYTVADIVDTTMQHIDVCDYEYAYFMLYYEGGGRGKTNKCIFHLSFRMQYLFIIELILQMSISLQFGKKKTQHLNDFNTFIVSC